MNYNTFSVKKEWLFPKKLSFTGRLENIKGGVYIKNGPAWGRIKYNEIVHPFDCTGFITKITFQNGEAWYQGRYVKPIGNIQGKSKAFKGPLNLLPIANVSNTNVVYWGGKLVSFFEGGAPYLIDFDTLETIGFLDGYKDGYPLYGMKQGNCVNAHPFKDITNHRLILMEMCFGINGETIIIFKEYDDFWNILHEQHVFIGSFLYTHDFVATDEYYIFCHHPLHIDYKQVFKGLGIAMCLDQNEKTDSYIYYVHRKTGKINKFVLKMKGFITHLCESHDHKYIYGICYHKYMKFQNGQLIKITIGTGDVENVSNIWCEFPTLIRDNIFVTGAANNKHPMQCIFKIGNNDVLENIYNGKENEIVGEPIGDMKGNIYFQKYDTLKNESALCIHDNDGKQISEIHIANEYVPLGLHGSFVDIDCDVK